MRAHLTPTRSQPNRHRSEGAGDEGFSLVELLVAMSIFMIIFGAVAVAIYNFQGTQSNVSARARGTSSALLSMDLLTKDIRDALIPTGVNQVSPIVIASPSQLEFYTTDGNGNVIEVNAQVTTNAAGACPCTLTETVLGTGVIRTSISNLVNQDVFSYLPPPSSGTIATTTSVPTTGVTDPSPLSIESVIVSLSVQPITNGPIVNATNTVVMRNLANSTP